MSRTVTFLLATCLPAGRSAQLSLFSELDHGRITPQLLHAPGVGHLLENQVGHIREKPALGEGVYPLPWGLGWIALGVRLVGRLVLRAGVNPAPTEQTFTELRSYPFWVNFRFALSRRLSNMELAASGRREKRQITHFWSNHFWVNLPNFGQTCFG